MVAITTGRSHLNSAIFDDLGGCIYSTCVARHRLFAHCNKPVMWVIRPPHRGTIGRGCLVFWRSRRTADEAMVSRCVNHPAAFHLVSAVARSSK
jgi:hypothetical protein